MANLIPLLRAAVKTAAGTNPVTALISQAIDEYAGEAHEKAAERAAACIDDRLNALGDRIDVDLVRKEEFVDLFKNCAVIIDRTQYDEKLRAAANILGNALIRAGEPDKLSYVELDHFTRCVEQLSIGSLRVLGKAIARGTLPGVGRHGSEVHQRNVRFDFSQLQSDVSEYDPYLLMGLLGELDTFGLLHLAGVPGVGHGSHPYHNYPVETTPLGYKFMRFILEPGTSSSAGASR
jgi:hypothetical protein